MPEEVSGPDFPDQELDRYLPMGCMTFYQIKVGSILGLAKIVPHLRLTQLEGNGIKGRNLSLVDHLNCS